ncbi:MAG: hypothetical protein ACFFDN_01030 [Candidatus Hodarchaeota archaeon]
MEKNIENKDYFVQRTKRKEQIMLFISMQFRKVRWVVLGSIQKYLESLGISNPDSKYIEILLSELAEIGYIEIYGCLRCLRLGEDKCNGCPYDLYKKEKEVEEKKIGITKNHRGLAKFVVIPTKIGTDYADSLWNEINGCYRYLRKMLSY